MTRPGAISTSRNDRTSARKAVRSWEKRKSTGTENLEGIEPPGHRVHKGPNAITDDGYRPVPALESAHAEMVN